MTDHVDDLMGQEGGLFHNNERFAMFTQLARLLAAEDIIVRWNVRGLGAPAAMQMAGRILDIAPIKREEEEKIPGLIFHEVGHFIFSDDLSKAYEYGDIVMVDKDKLEEFIAAVKNRHLWNIIEDGYIERRVVTKWPGTLKHFKVLYDDDRKNFKAKGNIILDTINILHLNVQGTKWGERFPYHNSLSPRLLDLLEKARTVMGSTLDRAILSSEIFDELTKLMPKPEVVKPIKFSKPLEIPDVVVPDEDDEPIGEIQPIEDAPPPTPEQKKQAQQMIEVVKDVEQSNIVNNLAAIDVTKEVKREKAEDKPLEEPKPEEPAVEAKAEAEEAEVEEEADERPMIEQDEPDVDQEGMLQEFISDNAAKILGSNLYYMQTIVEADAAGTERYVPNISEILATSLTLDVFSPSSQELTRGMTFNRFQMLMSKQGQEPVKEAVKLFNTFFKKMEQAKYIAQSMFQQFTTKANARNIALRRFKKTGSLDPTRASLFQIYDDVFQRKQLAPQQVNHSYVMMIDWSASMRDSTMELLHRAMELVQFARLAKIELEVWLYTTHDAKISSGHLAEIKHLVRDNVMLTGSRFIKVINTKEHNPDQMLYRMFSFFCICANQKGQSGLVEAALGNFVRHHQRYFIDSYGMSQNGTNTFEALSFAKHRIARMSSERKSILLCTDGEDGGWLVTLKKDIPDRKDEVDGVYSTTASKVYMGRVDLMEYGRTAETQLEIAGDKYPSSNNPFKNFRTTASFLLAEEARKNGISVVGITWGYYTNRSLSTIMRNNVVRVQVPLEDLRTRNLNKYEPVKNTFITNITEALLSNIRK